MRLSLSRTELSEALWLLNEAAVGGFALVLESIILGNVIRIRAQYAPKRVELDQEDGKDVMGVSYIRMLKRVTRLEGQQGLLRGIVPLTVKIVIGFLWCPPRGCGNIVPFYPILDAIARYCLAVLCDIPFTILFVRSITIPEMLPFFGMRRAARALLSPTERHRPWLLYLTPGLLLAIALEQAWVIFLVPLFTELVNHSTQEVWFLVGMTARTLARHSLVLLTAAICGPLEVIKVRLAVQRHEHPAVIPDEQHESSATDYVTDTVEPSETVTARVVGLRTDSDQPAYTGLFNCVCSIMAEEGFETFYRAWCFMLLAAYVTWR